MVRKTSKYPTGVRVRSKTTIQIWLSDQNDKRRWLTLPHPPTAQGIKTASEIRTALKNKKKWGILTEQDIAEACGKTLMVNDNRPTFGEYAQMYLDTLNSNNVGTRQKYKGILENHWLDEFAYTPIEDIKPSHIRQHLKQRNFKSNKTHNDALIPLRGIFELAFEDEIIDDNPTKRIKNKKLQESDPDPFTISEMQQILTWLKHNSYDIILYWYFEIAFWTGARPSELIVLQWSDIDFTNHTMSITKGRVRGIEQKTTKTSKNRLVYLNDKAVYAFQKIKALNRSSTHVFINQRTGEIWRRENDMRKIFKKATEKLNIRHRPAYNCRHTYATIMLMNGVNPAFASNQLGHSLLMFTKIYSKWLHGEQSRQEIEKLNQNF